MNFKQWLLKENTASQVKAVCSQMDLQKDSNEKIQDALFVLADLAQQVGSDTRAHDIMHARAVLPQVRYQVPQTRFDQVLGEPPVYRSSPLIGLYDNLITNGKQMGFLSFYNMERYRGTPFAGIDVNPPAHDANLFGINFPVEQIYLHLVYDFKEELLQQAIDAQQNVSDFLRNKNITLDMFDLDEVSLPYAEVTTDKGSTFRIQDHGFIRSPKFADYIKQVPYSFSPQGGSAMDIVSHDFDVVESDGRKMTFRPGRLLQLIDGSKPYGIGIV